MRTEKHAERGCILKGIDAVPEVVHFLRMMGNHEKILSREWTNLLSSFDYFSSVIVFLNFL